MNAWTAAFIAALTLTGCATIEKHPVATWVAAGIVAGSIAASTNHHTPSARGDDLCRGALSCK